MKKTIVLILALVILMTGNIYADENVSISRGEIIEEYISLIENKLSEIEENEINEISKSALSADN